MGSVCSKTRFTYVREHVKTAVTCTPVTPRLVPGIKYETD